MFCTKCGKEIAENAVMCVGCGSATENFHQLLIENRSSPIPVIRVLGIISIIMGFFVPIISWICGGIGLYKANKTYPKTVDLAEVRKLNIIGIIIGCVCWVLSMISFFAVLGSLNDFMYLF